MALFGLGKKKKDLPPPAPLPPPLSPVAPAAPEPAALPTDQVFSLMQQGYSDAQIVSILGQQGYDPQSINDAISQVSARGVEPMTPSPEEWSQPESRGESTEELVESIVEEKWHELQQQLSKQHEWRERTDSRLDKVEQAFQDLRKQIETLHKAIVAKIGDYDKTLLEVGTEIKAMEKVFQKVLPEMTSSVQELSKISKRLKGEKK